MEKSVTFTLYHQYENDILNTGTGAAKMLKNVQVACSCACVFISERSVCRLYFLEYKGGIMMKKRGISFLMACLMAVQPGLSVAAQSEENSVIRGADYTIRAHVDGTKTLTFYADLEASDYAGSSAAEDGREAGTER